MLLLLHYLSFDKLILFTCNVFSSLFLFPSRGVALALSQLTTWSTAQGLLVHIIPHSHCDPGYRKTFDQYFQEDVNLTINSVLQVLEVCWLCIIFERVSNVVHGFLVHIWWSPAAQNWEMYATAMEITMNIFKAVYNYATRCQSSTRDFCRCRQLRIYVHNCAVWPICVSHQCVCYHQYCFWQHYLTQATCFIAEWPVKAFCVGGGVLPLCVVEAELRGAAQGHEQTGSIKTARVYRWERACVHACTTGWKHWLVMCFWCPIHFAKNIID